MKKLILSITLFFSVFPMLVFALNDPATDNLATNAKSALIMEASTGKIVFEKNIHERYAPASMTKMMSLLLIMENIEEGKLSWDEEITTSAHASSMGGSQIFLQVGEKMSVRDLIRGIAIASGNDATVALAEKIGGTEEGFVKMMNDKAKALGLKNTNFKNAVGLDEENHYSSAYDMAVIASNLVKYEKILEYTGTYEGYLREGTDRKFWLVNTNKLVRFYQGVDGLKTGYTNEAGYCLTATAKKDNMRLITVVMGYPTANQRNSETSAMLDYGFNSYYIENLISTKTSLGKIELLKGDIQNVDIIPLESVNILNKKTDSKRNVDYRIETYKVEAPIKVGDVVGKLKVIENDKVINEIDLTVSENVKKANLFKLYYRYLEMILTGNNLY